VRTHFCFTCGLSTPPFSACIGNQHSKESVDFTTQKIYAKVTRPFFPLAQIKTEKVVWLRETNGYSATL